MQAIDQMKKAELVEYVERLEAARRHDEKEHAQRDG